MKNKTTSTGNSSDSLQDLKKNINNIGTIDGNYIGKFRLLLKASKFAPDEKEVPLLLNHVLQVYLIFVVQLCYTGAVSWYMYLHPDILIKILTILFSLHGVVLIVVYLLLIILLEVARIFDSFMLGIVSIFGISTAIGIPLGIIPILYDQNLILEALALTTIIFLGSALYGILTRNNLTGWGTPLIGGLLALIALGLFQHYYHNSMFNILILVADILIFTLFTAYDNQMIKIRFLDNLRDDIPDSNKTWWLLAMSNSINIYLDFVNLFLDILSLLGDDDD